MLASLHLLSLKHSRDPHRSTNHTAALELSFLDSTLTKMTTTFGCHHRGHECSCPGSHPPCFIVPMVPGRIGDAQLDHCPAPIALPQASEPTILPQITGQVIRRIANPSWSAPSSKDCLMLRPSYCTNADASICLLLPASRVWYQGRAELVQLNKWRIIEWTAEGTPPLQLLNPVVSLRKGLRPLIDSILWLTSATTLKLLCGDDRGLCSIPILAGSRPPLSLPIQCPAKVS
jgi:hypothetical protein